MIQVITYTRRLLPVADAPPLHIFIYREIYVYIHTYVHKHIHICCRAATSVCVGYDHFCLLCVCMIHTLTACVHDRVYLWCGYACIRFRIVRNCVYGAQNAYILVNGHHSEEKNWNVWAKFRCAEAPCRRAPTDECQSSLS